MSRASGDVAPAGAGIELLPANGMRVNAARRPAPGLVRGQSDIACALVCGDLPAPAERACAVRELAFVGKRQPWPLGRSEFAAGAHAWHPAAARGGGDAVVMLLFALCPRDVRHRCGDGISERGAGCVYCRKGHTMDGCGLQHNNRTWH